MTSLKTVWKRDYFKTAVSIALVVAIVLGFFFGLGLVLGTSVPIRVVESGSMCIDPNGCDGWSHAFDRTLHRGDIIIIQGIKAEDLNADYPNSDIIVYQKPTDLTATPIVHRIVAKYQDANGTWYFQTKGDGNGVVWPAPVTSDEYDSHIFWTTGQGVSQDLVYGRVVMRIPYFGLITLFMQENSWVLPAIVGLIMLVIAFEFVVPVARQKRRQKRAEQQNRMELKP